MITRQSTYNMKKSTTRNRMSKTRIYSPQTMTLLGTQDRFINHNVYGIKIQMHHQPNNSADLRQKQKELLVPTVLYRSRNQIFTTHLKSANLISDSNDMHYTSNISKIHFHQFEIPSMMSTTWPSLPFLQDNIHIMVLSNISS